MKIKHFMGYGCVNATKVSKVNGKDMFEVPYTKLVVNVKGNHEWGLVREDAYDLYNWLVKRFCKECTDYRQIEKFVCEPNYLAEVDECKYTFLLRLC